MRWNMQPHEAKESLCVENDLDQIS